MNIQIKIQSECLYYGKKISDLHLAILESKFKGLSEQVGSQVLILQPDNLRNANKAFKIIKTFVKKDLI